MQLLPHLLRNSMIARMIAVLYDIEGVLSASFK